VVYGVPRRLIPNIQAIDGLFLACRREVAEAIPGMHRPSPGSIYMTWMDFSGASHGFRLAVIADLPILHYHPEVFLASYGKPLLPRFWKNMANPSSGATATR